MQQRKLIVGGILIAAVAAGWALFRPDTLFVNKTVNDTFPGFGRVRAASGQNGPRLVAQGSFHSVAHGTEGTASVYQTADGARTLRLSHFATSNGPALYVYLVASDDAKDNNTVKQAGFVDLGPLKGNKGDQNYEVPAAVDLGKYRAVTIWCARFSVNFGTAPLASQEG
jgi:hypothetical protein